MVTTRSSARPVSRRRERAGSWIGRRSRRATSDAVVGLGVGTEPILEHAAGAEQAGHDGADRTLERLRDVLVLEPLDVGEHDHYAVVLGQLVQRPRALV